MNPKKISLKKFVDRRGYLLELLPKEFKKKFIYFIITKSKKNVLRGLHYDKNLQEEKLVFLLEGKY
jgi:dTDP-4-dehydrorhamnose 3,5-epimerase-like enzyme